MTSGSSVSVEDSTCKKEHLLKVLVIGEFATGKTAVVKRYVNNYFSDHYRSTIGVDFALKLVKYDEDTMLRLQLWDIAGAERFGNMTRVYYKDAVGCIVVFDVTRESTFEAAAKWKADLDNKVQLPNGCRIPCILLANKCDSTADDLANNADQMDEYCQAKGFIKWFAASAKENINIENSIQYLIDEIMKNIDMIQTSEKKGEVIVPNNQEAKSTGSSDNCCSGRKS